MRLNPSVHKSLILDEVSATLMYVGEAPTSSSTSSAVWRIKKVETIGTELKVTWADGNPNFDNIWDNRLSLTYI